MQPLILNTLSRTATESNKQRRYYHGAVIPLWAFLNGQDHRDGQVLADLHEAAKLEFNATTVIVGSWAGCRARSAGQPRGAISYSHSSKGSSAT